MNLSGGVLLGDAEREQMEVMVLPDNNPIVRELKAMDPYLSVVMVSDRADAPGLHPGCWHVKRTNPGTINTYLPIVGPNGEYRMPDSAIVDQLRARDLWREDSAKAIRRFEDQKQADKLADQLELRAEKRDEFLGRVKALRNPGIRYGGSWRAHLLDHKQ